MANRSKRTPRKRQIVLDAIAAGLTIEEAAHNAGIGRMTLYEWRAEDDSFRQDFEAAYRAGTDVFEAEARRRAFAESDVLLIFLLKCRDPARFNQKQIVAVGGDENAPPIGIAAQTQPPGVQIYLPANQREPLPTVPLPRCTIDVEIEATAELSSDETITNQVDDGCQKVRVGK
jgi:hypothetical protein